MGFSRPALHLVLITLPVSRYLVCDAHHIRKVGGAAGTKSAPLPTAIQFEPPAGFGVRCRDEKLPLEKYAQGPSVPA